MTGSLKAVRAAVVLVVFAIGVAVLVAVGTRSSPNTSSSAQTTSTTAATAAAGATTTTAAAHATTTSTTSRHGHGGATTTTTTVPHASVSVVVANGTQTNGLAAHFSNVIGAGGWNMGTPIDATTSQATSTVYYASGQQAAAQAIANTIGVKAAVQPLTTSTPVSGVTGTDVVVVIGQDLASAAAGS
jgi:hypothetical protein